MSTGAEAVIQRLVWLAENERIPLGITRLVKLLYLLDVEHCRRFGQRLTGLDWVFYHYGPYAFELETILGKSSMEREEIPLTGGKVIKRLKSMEGCPEPERLDYKAEGIISALLREWGTADLRELLDYVYFETEPMLNAKRADRLDFTSVGRYAPQREVRLNQARLKDIRAKAKNFLSAHPILRTHPTDHPDLAAAMKAWEPDRPLPPITFECEIDLSKEQASLPPGEDE
jgi:hypothetical protein